MAVNRLARAAALLVGLLALGACNDRPVDPLDSVVTAVNRQETQLPAKTKLDILFMIDNSGSMCEEQVNLGRNFQAISNFLFDELGASADYRIAVVSSDLDNPQERGNFLYKPAPPGRPINCDIEGYDTADCPADSAAIIRSDALGQGCPPGDRDCARANLEREFRCHATLGTFGSPIEKGLEAVRLALSCDGPNREKFAQCCVDGVYNPGCRIAPGQDEPEFLRPDAVLAVIYLTDEEDCSDPAENRAASNRVVCRPGGLVDSNQDGLPDQYGDERFCPTPRELPADVVRACEGVCANSGVACSACRRNAIERACFVRDCGLPPCGPSQNPEANRCTTAQECEERRCQIQTGQNSDCYWFRSNLVPVVDYYNSLTRLKASPPEQLIVATIAGRRAYTPSGNVITYNPVNREEQLLCVDDRRNLTLDKQCRADTDCPGVANTCEPEGQVNRCTGEGAIETCCPNGACPGHPQTSCESSNGEAFAGLRYLELSELAERGFEGGIGCPPGTEGTPDCVDICVDEFSQPLNVIREKIVRTIGRFCLQKPPACQVPTDRGPRACVNAAERADLGNYQVSVKMQCLVTEDQGGNCVELLEPELLGRDRWSLVFSDICAAGAFVQLNDPPPAGAEVFLEFPVAVGVQAASQRDAGPAAEVDASAE